MLNDSALHNAARHSSVRTQPGVMLVAVAVIFLTGCAGAVDSAVFMSAAPTVRADDVRIYSTVVPPCPYDELGVVTWQPKHGWHKLQGGVDQMRARAAEMGGHAITGFGVGSRDIGSTVPDATVKTNTVASGTVIRFRDGSCAMP